MPKVAGKQLTNFQEIFRRPSLAGEMLVYPSRLSYNLKNGKMSDFLATSAQSDPAEIAALLRELLPLGETIFRDGETRSLEAMLPQLYDELRQLAANYLRRERPNHTLQPTALVHEVYLKLLGDRPIDWKDRAHFLGISARIMRRILADSAIARGAQKRGGGVPLVALDEALNFSQECTVPIAGVDEALRSLEEIDPRQGKIVELRFFGGMTIEEIAEVLQISAATVKREWATAKLWLQHQLTDQAA